MAIPVKKLVHVLEAKYVIEADSIIILGSCDEGEFRHQINSSCFRFGDLDRVKEMTKTAELMVGKTITMIFDPDLDGKIKDHYALKY